MNRGRITDKLPKWIRKQTGELKAIARNILWENYLDYFDLGKINKDNLKYINFNKIKFIWETYWKNDKF